MPSLVEISSVVQKKTIFKISLMYFLYFVIISPWKRAGSYMFEQTSTKNAFCRVCLKLAPWFWRRFLKNSSVYFHSFVIISPWKRTCSFIWTILNPLYPRMLCAMFGWTWPSSSGEVKENVKSLRKQRRQRRRRTTDKLWSQKLTWAYGSGELKRTVFRWKVIFI